MNGLNDSSKYRPDITPVKDIRQMFDMGGFKSDETIRVVHAADKLRGDFDAVARRLAFGVRDLRGVIESNPVSERVGRRLFRGEDILKNWKWLIARYNPFGSMSGAEKQAFDILVDDIKMAKSRHLGVLVSIIYSDHALGYFDVCQHHVDESSSLSRSYNHSATIITDINQVVKKKLPGGSFCFELKEGGMERSLNIGDYYLSRGVDGGPPYNPLIHRAPQKAQSDTPRIMLSALLGR